MSVLVPQIEIVTAADSSHFRSAVQLLESIRISLPDGLYRVTFWDLGLSLPEREAITDFGVDLRTFEFHRYPGYFNMSRFAGSYAWKPIIISEKANSGTFQTGESRYLWWMDAGNVVTRRAILLCLLSRPFGGFTKLSLGRIQDYTAIRTLEGVGASQSLRLSRSRSAAYIALDLRNPNTRKLIQSWSKAALVEELISPPRESEENHRFDQSLLSIYWYTQLVDSVWKSTLDRVIARIPGIFAGVRIHQDID